MRETLGGGMDMSEIIMPEMDRHGQANGILCSFERLDRTRPERTDAFS